MRRQEDYREDTIRRLHEEKRLEANMSHEERISEKRFIRRTMMEQKEREMEEAILKVKNGRSNIKGKVKREPLIFQLKRKSYCLQLVYKVDEKSLTKMNVIWREKDYRYFNKLLTRYDIIAYFLLLFL